MSEPDASGTDDDETPEYGQEPFAVPAGATEIFLVRHGQSAPYRDGDPFPLVDGQGDPHLSPLGHWQAERIAERLASVALDAVYVTTLRRTLETATPLLVRSGIEPIVEADLREVHLGDWEGGVFRRMVAEGHPVMAEVDRTGDWGRIPGAETTDEVRQRVRRAIERIHERHPDGRVMAVSHGGAIGAVMAEASGARPLAFAGADNASISHLVILGDRWRVRRFNDTGHLSGELSTAAEAPT